MRAMRIKYFFITFALFTFVSCQTQQEKNIELKEFTKHLIELYINDIENLNAKRRKDEIILISNTDSLYFYLDIFSNNTGEYEFDRDDYIGRTMYLGHLVRIFGDNNRIFYSANKNPVRHSRISRNKIEYDPNIWTVCFYRDTTFCKAKTNKGTPSEDISEIEKLSEKYFNVSSVEQNELFQFYEVENSPKFSQGEDYMRKLIHSNFSVHKKGEYDNIPLVVNLIVDKNGNATVKGIMKSSHDAELDLEAIRVSEIICQYDFIPASHRGEKVNVIYPIVFFKGDIMR